MLTVVGDLVEDIVVWLDEPWRHGTDTEGRVFRVRGGSAANVAAAAARLGSVTRFIGCIGDDASGNSVLSALEADGVEVLVQRTGRTGTIVVLVDADGERTMVPDRGASAQIGPVDSAWVEGSRLVHATSYSFASEPAATSVARVLEQARESGVMTSLDASSTGMIESYGVDRYLLLLERLQPSFLVANRSEADLLGLGVADPHPVALASTTAVIKAGADPTTVLVPGQDPITVAVPPVADIRDLTGAGDAFAAGFLTGYLDSQDLRIACQRGHASAAKVLTSPGAGPGELG